MQFFSLDLSDIRELTVSMEAADGTDSESVSTSTEHEANNATDHQSDSNSELWEQFDFPQPQLTAEGDVQLTIALRGDTSNTQPTTSIETNSTMSPYEAMVRV